MPEARLPAARLPAYGGLSLPLAALNLPLYLDLPAFYAETAGLGPATIGVVLLAAWRERVVREAPCPVLQVEGDVVVPVEVASDKPEIAARTLRPKLHRVWDEYLHPLDGRDPNSYANLAWTSGRHDRPWPERPVFRQGALDDRARPGAPVRHAILPLPRRAAGRGGVAPA